MIDRFEALLRAELPDDADRLVALTRATVRVAARKARVADQALGASRFGGAPDLPPDTPWPEGREGPIEFVCQLDLTQVPRGGPLHALPPDGVLSFFCGWTRDGEWDHAVIHSPAASIQKRHRERRGTPRVHGMDLAGDAVPAPWSSFFVASATRRPQYDRRSHANDLWFQPVVELSEAAHERYTELYERWSEESGGERHGLFGYDRPMECELAPREIMLLRLDADGTTGHDFLEACTLYFVITEAALAQRDFASARAVYGASI